MPHKPIVLFEFSSIRESNNGFFTDCGQSVSPKAFDNLWEFSHMDEKKYPEMDKVFSKSILNGKRRISAKNYVGTIQTVDGTIFEILPKIYRNSGQQEKDQATCRNIFLKMLSSMYNSTNLSFQEAGIHTQKNFPILEIYIRNYIEEAKKIIFTGLGKDYVKTEKNSSFLKGRLLIKQNIKYNTFNRSHFYISYNEYEDNIPQNRIIVTTLYKLQGITTSTSNKADINTLIEILADIPISSNIPSDLQKAENIDRTKSKYELIINWSRVILKGEGFTSFNGKCVNQVLLYSADKLFESYIAQLFKSFYRKNSSEYHVHTQHTGVFLVDKHNDKCRFSIRPDIVVEHLQEQSLDNICNCIILDTKWKCINENLPRKDYLIDIKDMYQLYAYGKKYQAFYKEQINENIIPKLVLIYPQAETFTHPIEPYIYESGDDELSLFIEPFDLTFNYKEQMDQVQNIVSRISKQDY